MNQKQARAVRILRIAALIAAVACISIGVFRNESAVVLRKAIRICLECIGVGG